MVHAETGRPFLWAGMNGAVVTDFMAALSNWTHEDPYVTTGFPMTLPRGDTWTSNHAFHAWRQDAGTATRSRGGGSGGVSQHAPSGLQRL